VDVANEERASVSSCILHHYGLRLDSRGKRYSKLKDKDMTWRRGERKSLKRSAAESPGPLKVLFDQVFSKMLCAREQKENNKVGDVRKKNRHIS
jgi:hypothetical protein